MKNKIRMIICVVGLSTMLVVGGWKLMYVSPQTGEGEDAYEKTMATICIKESLGDTKYLQEYKFK